MWKHMARVVDEVRPRFVFVENSPMLTSRGLGTVLGDLAEMGYNARWCVLGADDAGAPHQRKRIWILAYLAYSEGGGNRRIAGEFQKADEQQKAQRQEERIRESYYAGKGVNWWDIDPAELPDTRDDRDEQRIGRMREGESIVRDGDSERGRKKEHESREWWPTESRLGRVADRVANRVDRLKAIGNGQVPSVAAIAFLILSQGLTD